MTPMISIVMSLRQIFIPNLKNCLGALHATPLQVIHPSMPTPSAALF